MIEYLNNKINELKDNTDDKSLVEFNKAVLIKMGYQNRYIYHDDVRNSLGEYAIEAYLRGREKALKENNGAKENNQKNTSINKAKGINNEH